MEIGWLVSLIVGGIMMVVIIVIGIAMGVKYTVRENGKINYKKSTVFLR